MGDGMGRWWVDLPFRGEGWVGVGRGGVGGVVVGGWLGGGEVDGLGGGKGFRYGKY